MKKLKADLVILSKRKFHSMTNQVNFDDYTQNYNQLLREGTGFFSSNEEYFAKYKVDLIRKRINSPVYRLLEYGCGIGRNIPFLQEAFPSATIFGSDISGASLEIARQENINIEFLQENEHLEFTESFDLIFVAGVFHHIPVVQREQVIRTLYNRLSPGGQLFIFEHNPFNPITRRIVNNCPYDEDAILIKPSELTMMLREAEFIIDSKAYCLFVPPALSILSQIENKLGWLPLGGQYWVHASRKK